jgi:hypothetical protein
MGRRRLAAPPEDDMKFVLLIHGDDKVQAQRTEAETQRIMGGHMKLAGDLRAAGKLIGAERLRPEREAVRLRLKGGQRQVIDGPFAETKEVLGGFYLIECASTEEAVELASRLLFSENVFVEVRPVWDM